MTTPPPLPTRRASPVTRPGRWADLLVAAGLVGFLFAVIALAREWAAPAPPTHETPPLDLSPWMLPVYAFYSLSRGLIAYALSLGFTLVYGYWAAKDRLAERGLIPLLDILQSIPVLGFLPGVVLLLVHLVPNRMVGRELAAILLIFTGQVWNMTFSFYHSLKSQPAEQQEVSTIYRFSWWQQFRWVELPFATVGLVWNSMMSMAGGWFFLMICESAKLGGESYRLPGLGSYMVQAVEVGDVPAQLWAVVTMVLMIVLLDQLLWNPVAVWAQKFRTEEGGAQEQQKSWFLDLLQRSRFLRLGGRWLRKAEEPEPEPSPTPPAPAPAPAPAAVPPPDAPPPKPSPWPARVSVALFVLLVVLLSAGAVGLVWLLWSVTWDVWLKLVGEGFLTLFRVLAAVAIGTLWAVPAGLFVGLSPRLRQGLQPVIQVLASFPAPMLFPVVASLLAWMGGSLEWGAVVLMLLGTQWYILFNVVAGSMAIPSDLQEMARSYRLTLWQRFRSLYLPAIFPFLVTGWVTAAGGAWNASIVSEWVEDWGVNMPAATGLGAEIQTAVSGAGVRSDSEKPNPPPGASEAEGTPQGGEARPGPVKADLPLLAASVLVMALMVVAFNRLVWRRLHHLAATRFSLSK